MAVAHHEMLVEGFDEGEAALIGKAVGVLERFLKVVAVLDEFSALGDHGAILLHAVAEGNDDDCFQAEEPGGHGHSLAEVASGSCDYACGFGLRLLQPVQIDQRAADLEGSDGGVVFVLDPGFDAQAAG